MPTIDLDGCSTEPLGSYLKALGVLRLLGEQADSTAAGSWHAGRFRLATSLDLAEVIDFLLDDYEPTPLLSPWNGGSGFTAKDVKSSPAAVAVVDLLASTTAPRLQRYREAIAAARAAASDPRWERLEKDQQVQLCRSTFPDDALVWIDAAVVLTTEKPAFPPLLGTGGNVGRLEFANNFMQRLIDVLRLGAGRGTSTREGTRAWLVDSLTGSSTTALLSATVGQFDPGRVGGANSGPLGDAGSLVNPWDFVLAFEGAVVFASGAARRLGSNRGDPSMPFMVSATPVGYSSASNVESSKGELWAPTWSKPTTAREIVRLVGEGRASWNGRSSRSGLDFVRAAASLGTDRGIDGFTRHVIVERYGQAMLAVPAGRVSVGRTMKPQVPVLAALDRWVDRVRHLPNLPGSVSDLIRELDAAQYEVALDGGARSLQSVLVAAAQLDGAIGRSSGLRAERGPLGGLHAAEWLPVLDDGCVEFRLARAFASQRDGAGNRPALMLRPIEGAHRLSWAPRPPLVDGLGRRPVIDVLSTFAQRRFIEAEAVATPREAGEQVGIAPSFSWAIPAPIEDVVSFYRGGLDEERLARLISGLLLLEFDDERGEVGPTEGSSDDEIPPMLRLLIPFWTSLPAGERTHGRALRAGAGWPRLLTAGRTEQVANDAIQRLRVAGLTPLIARLSLGVGTSVGPRVLASLSFPVSRSAALRALDSVATADLDQLISTNARKEPS